MANGAGGAGGSGAALGVGLLWGSGQSIGETLAAKSLADDARSFQEKVLKNQITWRMRDMRRAGINPILAARPGGITSASPAMAQPGRAGSTGANTAEAIRRARREETELDLIRQQERTSQAQQLEAYERAFNERAAGHWHHAQHDYTRTQNELMSLQLPHARAVADYDRSAPGRFGAQVDRALQPISKNVPGFGLLLAPPGRRPKQDKPVYPRASGRSRRKKKK